MQKRNDKTSSKDAGDTDTDAAVADSSTNGSEPFVSMPTCFQYVVYTRAYYVYSYFSIFRSRDKQHSGLDSLPMKNVSRHHRKRKWEKTSGFVGSKTDVTFTDDGGRSKMEKRAATSSNKRISMMDGLADSRKAIFSGHGAPRNGGKRGIEHENRHQKERNRARRPVKASKFHHKNSSSR